MRNSNNFLSDESSSKSSKQSQNKKKVTRQAIKSKKRKLMRIFLVMLTDILLVGVGLVVFALFHHVLPQSGGVEPVKLPVATATAQVSMEPSAITDDVILPSQTEEATIDAPPTPTPILEDLGTWGEKFAEQFTSEDVIQTDNSYQSKDINVTIDKIKENGVTYFIADIYLRDIENFKTAFANGTYGRGNTERTVEMAKDNDAIIAVSGDYYGIRQDGIVIRNGELYRDNIYKDILIMNNDGSMETFSPDEFMIDDIMQNGAYQGWSFGPMLLTNGQPMEKFNSDVPRANPRCAIGYYEPGHYCFVLVDGRQPGYSDGMTLQQLSTVFYDLGCSVAYNLDGGQSAMMAFMGEVMNQPYKGGRDISDIVYIAEDKEVQ